jgi:hypothetical protein
MDVRIIQKASPIPSQGFVVNVETPRQDVFENDGVFNEAGIATVLAVLRSDRRTRLIADPRRRFALFNTSGYVTGSRAGLTRMGQPSERHCRAG